MIDRFSSVVGQRQAIRLLQAFLRQDKIPHALLFSGIDGTGKRTAAVLFAMACNCAERQETSGDGPIRIEPCGQCRSCRKILAGGHPDIHELKPSGQFIRIDQVRDFCAALSMKPYEAETRAAVINDAHALNPEAGNALLKVLEEPPGRTVIILTALQASDLLPTIVSRCQQVPFHPIPPKRMADHLTQAHGADPETAAVIAGLAGGSLARALSMMRDDACAAWINFRNWLISAGGLMRPEALSARPVELLMAFAEALARQKDALGDALEIMKSWLRDLLVFPHCPEQIINADLRRDVAAAATGLDAAAVLRKIAALQEAQRKLRANANPRLTLEAMMMRMAEKAS